jgi:hypothetical protein
VVEDRDPELAAFAARNSAPAKRRRLLRRLHWAAAAYVLPALFLGSRFRSLDPRSFAFCYQMSAIVVFDLFVGCWSIYYWGGGFYTWVYRLSPEVRARTGARVRIGFRSIGFDRSVGWRAAVALQLRFLGLLFVSFLVWSVLVSLAVTFVVALSEGPAGVVKFYRHPRS